MIEFDKQDQLDQITPWVLPTETLRAVFDCKGGGTGFVAITDRRVMFYDKAFLGKRKALTSIPFGRISSVSSVDEGRGLFGATSMLVLKSGADAYEFEFRGGDKAQKIYSLMMTAILMEA